MVVTNSLMSVDGNMLRYMGSVNKLIINLFGDSQA